MFSAGSPLILDLLNWSNRYVTPACVSSNTSAKVPSNIIVSPGSICISLNGSDL